MDNTRKELTKQERERIDDLLAEAMGVCDNIDPKGWEINEEQFQNYCDALLFCTEYAKDNEGTVRHTLKPQDLGAGYITMKLITLDICMSDLNVFEKMMHDASCFGVMPNLDYTIDVSFTFPNVLKPKASNKEWCEIKEIAKNIDYRSLKRF